MARNDVSPEEKAVRAVLTAPALARVAQKMLALAESGDVNAARIVLSFGIGTPYEQVHPHALRDQLFLKSLDRGAFGPLGPDIAGAAAGLLDIVEDEPDDRDE
jgi:hypothetical protein